MYCGYKQGLNSSIVSCGTAGHINPNRGKYDDVAPEKRAREWYVENILIICFRAFGVSRSSVFR